MSLGAGGGPGGWNPVRGTIPGKHGASEPSTQDSLE
jgi:hypothetical protein